MRVLILTIGTRGDVQPYLALSKRLKSAGHTVALCTCPRFEGFIAEHGIAFYPLEEGLLEILETDFGRAMVSNLNGIGGALKSIPKVMKKVGPIHRRMVADAWVATEKFKPDILLYHPKMFCAPAFAAQLKIPAILAILYPMQVPTGDYPFFGMPRLPLGKVYNRATYKLVAFLTRVGSRSYMKDWAKEHATEPLSVVSAKKPDGVLHGFSEAVISRPTDWPKNAVVSGYWFLDDLELTKPSQELVEFLKAGEPPVYIGFGSMAGTDTKNTTETIVSAVKAAGVRAVIATGWGGIDQLPHSDQIHFIKAISHNWLFPQVSAVVHHGGAGTTAAGLHHGRPTVICPFALDQPFWGQLVNELGAGPQPIFQKKLTAENLAEALTLASTDPEIRAKANAMGKQIQQEDGLSKAVEFIETYAVPKPTEA